MKPLLLAMALLWDASAANAQAKAQPAVAIGLWGSIQRRAGILDNGAARFRRPPNSTR